MTTTYSHAEVIEIVARIISNSRVDPSIPAEARRTFVDERWLDCREEARTLIGLHSWPAIRMREA